MACGVKLKGKGVVRWNNARTVTCSDISQLSMRYRAVPPAQYKWQQDNAALEQQCACRHQATAYSANAPDACTTGTNGMSWHLSLAIEPHVWLVPGSVRRQVMPGGPVQGVQGGDTGYGSVAISSVRSCPSHTSSAGPAATTAINAASAMNMAAGGAIAAAMKSVPCDTCMCRVLVWV